MATLYLGVDGGETETLVALADAEGQLVAAARSGPANPAVIGERAAAHELKTAVDVALRRAGAELGQVRAAAFGIAGADGPSGSAAVERVVQQSVPLSRRFVDNEAVLVLRAGTLDAVGVGLVVGAATSCTGRDRYGRRHQVGGLGAVSGDVGYGEDLAMRAVGGAWMAHDGRSGPSALSSRIPGALGLGSIEDVPKVLVRGVLPESLVYKVVRTLFSEARGGDGLALRIMEETGARLGAAAAAVLRHLVLKGPNALVVLSGTVIDLPGREPLLQAIERRIQSTVSETQLHVLDVPPVLGALLFARDLEGFAPPAFVRNLRSTWRTVESGASIGRQPSGPC